MRCCAALRTDALSRRVRAQRSHSRRPSPPAPCGARCGARRGVQTLLSRAGKCHCAPRGGGAPAPWRDASTKARRSAHHVCRTARAEEAEEARYEPVMHACIVRLPSGSWHAATGMPRIPHRHAARRRARRLMRRELSAKHAFRFASLVRFVTTRAPPSTMRRAAALLTLLCARGAAASAGAQAAAEAALHQVSAACSLAATAAALMRMHRRRSCATRWR